jgi:hypothetical protein
LNKWFCANKIKEAGCAIESGMKRPVFVVFCVVG